MVMSYHFPRSSVTLPSSLAEMLPVSESIDEAVALFHDFFPDLSEAKALAVIGTLFPSIPGAAAAAPNAVAAVAFNATY